MNNQIYVFYVLKKIDRTNVRTTFNETFDFLKHFEQSRKDIFLDCLVMAMTERSEISSPEQTLRYFHNDFSGICSTWQNSTSKFTRRFSKQKNANTGDWQHLENIHYFFRENPQCTVFLKYLATEISLTETRGVPFDEPRIEVSNSILPTSKRYTFFEALVPLNTEWRK